MKPLTKIVLFAVVVIGGIYGAHILRELLEGTKAGQEDYYRRLLSRDGRVRNVSIGGYEQELGQFTVTTVRFTIADKPNSSVALFVGRYDEMLQPLRIYQIGDLSPVVLVLDEKGRWLPRCPSLGNDLTDHISPPWQNMTVSDLVSRYDELVAHFAKWPVYPDFGTLRRSNGNVRYYIDRPGTNAKNTFVPGPPAK